ncbi:MAG: hypothetical protein JXL20_01220 [Deltaproteobacteria bacterium]|nr:hypothetical protein [Deltaproteobacteria bacterium]
MPYSVSFAEEGFVLVVVSSPCTRDDHYSAMNQAVTLTERHVCSSLLVDLRELSTEAFSTTGCFTFGKKLAETTTHLKIAHVLPSDAKSSQDVRFTSTVEANRGKTTGEFSTVEEARQWLLYK